MDTTYRIYYTYPCETFERRVEREADYGFVNNSDGITLVSELKVGDQIYVYSNLGTVTRIETL